MASDITPESIAAEILAELAEKVDVREGGYTAELVAPAALAIYKIYQRMQAAVPMFYIDETSGPYIDEQGKWYGITRKPGAHAAASLEFSGDAGIVVPKGSIFTTQSGLRFATRTETTLPNCVEAEALEVGQKYNVHAGEITRQYISVPGITAVTNPELAQGGVDAESDAALFGRIDAYRKKPVNGSNAAQYESWAMEVDGVGKAKVQPLKNGPGSVGVLLAGPEGGPVDSTIVRATAKHIEEVREIGVVVDVQSAAALIINITAKVQHTRSTTPQQVREKLEENLTLFLRGLTFEKYTIPYNRIAYMLLDIAGVENYTTLTVNGATGDIAIAENKVPVLGEVQVTV